MKKNEFAPENFKNLSFEEFITKSYFPLLKKVDDMEQSFKKEQEGIFFGIS